MRLLFIVVLLSTSTLGAQDIDVDELVRTARAERSRARCMLRAAGRTNRLAARYRQTQSAAARTRLAEQITAVATERQVCLDAIDAGRGAGIGSVGVMPQPLARAPLRVRIQTRFTSPRDHIPEARRVWGRAQGRLRGCVRQAFNQDPTPIPAFAMRYAVTPDGNVGPFEGVPTRLTACFEFLRRAPQPEAMHGMSVRIVVRVFLEPTPSTTGLY